MIRTATAAKQRAYAPYSGYRVGAALLCADGSVHTGCNVENAAYGLSICAERVAVFKAVSEGCLDFKTLALATDSTEPVSPCGACLQVLSEFNPNLPILMVGDKERVKRARLSELLPAPFKGRLARHEATDTENERNQ